MTKTHRSNLAITAIYLLENKPPPKFKMDFFFSGANNYVPRAAELMNECGTSACFAGHGPLALPKRWRRNEEWDDYTRRVFGCDLCDRKGAFLFGATWSNSRRQAAARALVVLEEGEPPPYYSASSSRYFNRMPTAKLIARLRVFVTPDK